MSNLYPQQCHSMNIAMPRSVKRRLNNIATSPIQLTSPLSGSSGNATDTLTDTSQCHGEAPPWNSYLPVVTEPISLYTNTGPSRYHAPYGQSGRSSASPMVPQTSCLACTLRAQNHFVDFYTLLRIFHTYLIIPSY